MEGLSQLGSHSGDSNPWFLTARTYHADIHTKMCADVCTDMRRCILQRVWNPGTQEYRSSVGSGPLSQES